jgi:sugar lactone lactonase YvrE
MTRLSAGAAFCLISGLAFGVRAAEPVLAQTFDPSAGELPESISFDEDGNAFLSMGSTIRRLTPEGELELWATLPIAAFALGVKVGPDGCVYNASTSLDPSVVGAFVWRTCAQGAIEQYAALEPTAGPNDLAFDERGNLYVTDPIGGKIFRIDAYAEVTVWLDHPLLKGNPSAPALKFSQQGVNGIAFARNGKRLYVGNLDFGRILELELKHDDEFDALRVFAESPLLVGADALALDKNGKLYVAVGAQDQLVSVNKHGAVQLVSQSSLLNGPAGLAFGVEPGHRKTLYIADLDFLKAFGQVPGTPEPNLLKLVTDTQGLPLLD